MARNTRKVAPTMVQVRAVVGVRAELPDGRRVSLAAGKTAEVKADVASRMVATGRAEIVEAKKAAPKKAKADDNADQVGDQAEDNAGQGAGA